MTCLVATSKSETLRPSRSMRTKGELRLLFRPELLIGQLANFTVLVTFSNYRLLIWLSPSGTLPPVGCGN